MPITYIAYYNEGKSGMTWAALVAASLMLLNKPSTSNEITLSIWQKQNPPEDLKSRVSSTLRTLVDRGFVTTINNDYIYKITSLGERVFQGQLNQIENWTPRSYSDSKLFENHNTRKNVIKFKRRA